MGFLYPADARSLASTRVGCGGVLLPLASEEMSRACPLVYSSFIPCCRVYFLVGRFAKTPL